jgi:predicted nucleic acid-binding Zn ribbon protein
VRTAPRSLSGALRSLTNDLAPATTLARVQEIWERTAGPAIDAAAKPTAEHNGILTVTCEAAVWAQELDLMAPELIPTLNAALVDLDPKLGAEALRGLRCRTG